jgi:hypothetical protein
VLKLDDLDDLDPIQNGSPSQRSGEWLAGVRCFVTTDELRRLLCLMAGTEILHELCKNLHRASGSTREMELPPALL